MRPAPPLPHPMVIFQSRTQAKTCRVSATSAAGGGDPGLGQAPLADGEKDFMQFIRAFTFVVQRPVSAIAA